MRVSQIALAVVALSTSAAAAPIHHKRWFPDSWWQATAAADSMVDFIKRHPWPGVSRVINLDSLVNKCDTAKASLPAGSEALPPIGAGLSLYHVALGRGTQNYTCPAGNATAPPAAVGAVAFLFNATCMAATNNQMLSLLTPTAVNLPNQDNGALYPDLSGHHYFIDKTTAYFNLKLDTSDYGQGAFKKIAATPAPADAMKGPGNQGNGAVPWLKLVQKDPNDTSFKVAEVYRVNTAGGNPPATCAGMPEFFEVQYSADYYMYGK
jgi:hypothetical protein